MQTKGKVRQRSVTGDPDRDGGLVGPNCGPSWHVVGAGQFNNSYTKSDIVWQHDSGQAAAWLMDGTSLVGGGLVGGNPGADWDLIV